MRKTLLSTAVTLLCISLAGCIVVAADGSCWRWRGPTVWAESTETLTIDTASLEGMVVETHNGAIVVDGQSDGAAHATVTVTKKGGGISQGEAEAALAAIDVYVKPGNNGTTKIGWRWKGVKKPRWRSQVSFEITAPGNLRIDAETHNGRITLENVTADARVVTHNGAVNVDVKNGKLRAETHNGEVVATYAGPEVRLQTHNGRIVADLAGCAEIDGRIITHNGGVQIIVNQNTSADLSCATHNGGISFDFPVPVTKISRTKVTGVLGSGGPPLKITTHNGAIRIKSTKG